MIVTEDLFRENVIINIGLNVVKVALYQLCT